MLAEFLTVASFVIVAFCIRILFYFENAAKNANNLRGNMRGYTVFMYGPRTGYASIIADMICNSLVTNGGGGRRKWKVVHQHDYYKSEEELQSTKECCGVVENNGEYQEYNVYDSVRALDISALNIAIESYARMGVNVIVEGHIVTPLRGIYANSPEIIIQQNKEALSALHAFKSTIAGIKPTWYEKILDKYTLPNWNVSCTILDSNKSTNRVTIEAEANGHPVESVISTLYLSIAEYFRRICEQDNIRNPERVFTTASLFK